jgi:hypothetical protein
MAHRHAVDYRTYFGPPEPHDDPRTFYIPFWQPVWNDPQHDHHVKRWRWLTAMATVDDDSDLIPEARPAQLPRSGEA